MANLDENLIAIGDLQGCFESLKALLEQLPEHSALVFLGDLVNRGPDSLKTLRHVKSLCESGRARCVLGNHDLHLLALVATGSPPRKKDTLSEILKANDCDELIDWLRRQPLLIDTPSTVFVHAAIDPAWPLVKAKRLAHEVEVQLASDDWTSTLSQMYGTDLFAESLTGQARVRAILNVFTRMRFLKPDLTADFELKEGIAKMPPGYTPWFEVPRQTHKTICFGHWSMLGLVLRHDTVAVDTGCLWGGALSAVRLMDRRLYQEPCPCWARPGG